MRIIVESQDADGFPVELHSHMTCSDWVACDGAPVTVHYDPDVPTNGWIELDYRRRLKTCALIIPLMWAIGGAFVLFG